jgi:hypothetical protein
VADEPTTIETEREVVRVLQRRLISADRDAGYDLSFRDGETLVRVEEVLLDVSDGRVDDVVILFRDLSRPEYLFRMRMEATDPDLPDAEIWAGIILANLQETIVGGPGISGHSGFNEGDATRILDV